MSASQAWARKLALRTERLGPLPLVNHFLARLGLERHLETFLPTADRRIRVPCAKALGVLGMRSIKDVLSRGGHRQHDEPPLDSTTERFTLCR